MKLCYNKNCLHCLKDNICWYSEKVYQECGSKITKRKENETMDEIKLNLDNLNETEKEQLMVLVEKANSFNGKKPKEDEKYYAFYCDGTTNMFTWNDSKVNNDMYSIGNCFQTREQAEWTVEHLKVKAELQRFADKHNTEPIDWDNEDQEKWMLQYEDDRNMINFVFCVYIKCADTVYFTSGEIAQQAVIKIGEERLKKYYFGVEK